MSARYVEGSTARPAYLVWGEDDSLVAQELAVLTEELRAIDPGGLDVVEEYAEPGNEDGVDLGEILNACRTTPLFSTIRVVVVRGARALDAGQQGALVSYLADPNPTTVLVLVYALSATGSSSTPRRPPKRVLDAVASCGLVITTAPGSSTRDRTKWVTEHLRASGVHCDPGATALIAEHLGEDLGRLESIEGTLLAAYGPGAKIGVDDVAPFLGEAGGVAPWDLTDALDAGDAARAVAVLHRMLDGGARPPLAVLASLHRHVAAMLRLDGAGGLSEADAAAATGLAPYPAKKALGQSRKLGHERLVEMVTLVADADLDLRGRLGWPPELVLEVLVARLARLTRRAPGARRASAPVRR